MDNNFFDFFLLVIDGDLVWWVLEVEEQELFGGGDGVNSNIDYDIVNVDLLIFNYGGVVVLLLLVSF